MSNDPITVDVDAKTMELARSGRSVWVYPGRSMARDESFTLTHQGDELVVYANAPRLNHETGRYEVCASILESLAKRYRGRPRRGW